MAQWAFRRFSLRMSRSKNAAMTPFTEITGTAAPLLEKGKLNQMESYADFLIGVLLLYYKFSTKYFQN